MANRCKIVLQNYLKTRDIDLYRDYKIVNYIIYYKNKLFFVFCSNNTILKYDNAGKCIIKDYKSPDYQYYYNNK